MARGKILIIDDDKALASSIGRVLVADGYEVITAPDGISGTALAVQQKPNLILMDLRMPAGDGHTVGKRLRENMATCSIPIIVLSGAAHADDVRTAKDWGALSLLYKPFSFDDLKAAVADALFGEAKHATNASGKPVESFSWLRLAPKKQ